MRYNFESDEQRLDFIDNLKSTLVGKRYDFKRVIHILMYQKLFELKYGA